MSRLSQILNRKSEYEKKLLGQIITSEQNEVWHQLTVTSQHFSGQNKQVYEAIDAVIDRGADAKLDSVYAQDRTINPAYLAELTDDVFTSANWEWYEQQLIELDRVARLHGVAAKLPQMAEEGASAALDWIYGEIDHITQTRRSGALTRVSELTADYTNLIQQRYDLGGKLPGLESGFRTLDNALNGFQKSRLYYVGGRPSMGKSALLLNMATYMGYRRKTPFVYLSLESSREEVFDRMAAQIAKIDSRKIQRGELRTKGDFERLMNVLGDIHEMPMYLYDVPNQTINQVKAVARRAVNIHGAKAIFVDYLQLIRVQGADDRTAQVAQASMELKDLSRELEVPVICAAQLRRDADDRSPQLGDIQWASQAEQDADTALFIHRDKKTQDMKIIIAKNRDGQTGSVPVTFVGHYVMFAESAQGYDHAA